MAPFFCGSDIISMRLVTSLIKYEYMSFFGRRYFFIRIFKYCFILSILVCACVFGVFFFFMHNRCIDFSALEQYNPGRPSIVYDMDGEELLPTTGEEYG